MILQPIIENAITHGIKLLRHEKGIVSVSAKIINKKIIFTITNNGPEIPEEKLNSLFEKFIRMDDKTTRTTRGTGLGLFIVKGLVEAMNGKIKISSTDEVGFNVEITLPLFKSVTLKP